MMDILKSASKLAFLAIAGTVCSSFLMGILPVNEFKELALMAFTFYFTHKQVGKVSTEEETK